MGLIFSEMQNELQDFEDKNNKIVFCFKKVITSAVLRREL